MKNALLAEPALMSAQLKQFLKETFTKLILMFALIAELVQMYAL